MSNSPDKSQQWLAQNWTLAGRLVRDVTHDVNNQLGAVLAYAELLALETDGRVEVRAMVEEIAQAIERASLLLDTLASIPSRDIKTVQPVDLCAIVRDTLLLFEREADRRNVRVVSALPEAPVMIQGVHARLARLMAHVMGFAFDSIARSERMVDLRVQVRGGLDTVAIRISGFAPDARCSSSALAEAIEHAKFHRGSIELAPESATITIPLDPAKS